MFSWARMLQLAGGPDEEYTVNIVKSLYVYIGNHVAKCYIKFLLLKCHKIEIQDEINKLLNLEILIIAIYMYRNRETGI